MESVVIQKIFFGVTGRGMHGQEYTIVGVLRKTFQIFLQEDPV